MNNKIVAKNTFYQTLTRVVTSFTGFLITIFIAKEFGPQGFGDFTKITSFVAMFYLPLDFGLNAFFLQNKEFDFKSLFYLRLMLAIIVFVILNLITIILPFDSILGTGFSGEAKIGIYVFSLSLFLQAIIISTASIFQKKLNYLPYAIGIVIGAILNVVLVYIFSSAHYPIIYTIFSFLFGNLLSALILLILTKEKIFPPQINIEKSKDLLIKSFPLGLMLIFNLIYFRIDIFLLSVLKGSQEVGVYGLSYRFFDFLLALPLFISNAMYPFLLKERENKKTFFIKIRKYFIFYILGSLIIIPPFWFISPLFGFIKEGFLPAIIPFRILLLSLPIFFATSFLQWVLISLGKQKYLMYAYIMSAVINILLNIIFIPKFSYLACALITVLSEGVVFVFLFSKTLSLEKIHEKE